MSDAKENKGEGNPAADKRYRAGVRDTVDSTSEKERADKARDVSKDELKEIRKAEDNAKTKH